MGTDKVFKEMSAAFGQIAVLIDPEKTNKSEQLDALIKKSSFAKINYFFVGGSTVTRKDIEFVVSYLKKNSSIPVVIFPGGNHQLSEEADALLYLSLVSGRNPDFLISHHVNNALEVFELGIEIIPTAYILVEGGTKSSVAYVSQTTPIPREQKSIALNTALAALMQGKQLVYFDAGSGAKDCVPQEFVAELRKYSDAPIIVGGGIRDIETLKQFKASQANVLVIGNKLEEDIDFLLDVKDFLKVK